MRSTPQESNRRTTNRGHTLDREARLAAMRSEVQSLRRALHAVKRALGRALDVRDMLAATARTIPEQTEGWGQYNYAIAQVRTSNYLRCLMQWITTLRAGYCIEDCAIVLLGDMISGDIHEELVRTSEAGPASLATRYSRPKAEGHGPGAVRRCTCRRAYRFPPPVQAMAVGRLVAALVSGLAGRFRAVNVYGVGGSNHGRLSRKYQFKGGVLNNWDFVVYEHARALLARHGNVTLRVLTAKKEAVRIANHWFLCGHGDHVKSWMGIPWYGIERDVGRESRRRLDRLQEQLRHDAPTEGMMDYILGAHWHTPFIGPSFRYIVNGSLSGTNEFDHSCGRHAPPQQVAALVSPKHGLFEPVAWRLDTEEEAALIGTDSTGLFVDGTGQKKEIPS